MAAAVRKVCAPPSDVFFVLFQSVQHQPSPVHQATQYQIAPAVPAQTQPIVTQVSEGPGVDVLRLGAYIVIRVCNR